MAQAQPFFWGSGGEQLTYEQTKKRREVADALAAKGETPQTFGAGLNRIGEALLAKSYGDQATAAETAGADSRRAVIEALTSNPDPAMGDIMGALGNDWVANDAGSSAIVQALLGQELQQNDPLRQMQIEKGQLELDALRNPVAPEPDYPTSYDEFLLGQQNPDYAATLGKGGQTINVGGNNDIGTIPPGMMVLRDEAGNITGMKPIPGGPAEAEALAAAAKADTGAGRREVATDVVTTAASIARELAAKPGNTGLTGAVWSNLSETEAAEMRRQVDVLKATATIENLTAMRQASPTGGALGSVTEKEGAMLAAASGAIDPNSSGPDFQRALDNYERTLLQIVHGPEEGQRIFESTRPPASNFDYNAPAAPEGWGGDPALWQFMSPEDRALW